MANLHVKVINRSFIKASNTSIETYTVIPSNFDTFPGSFPSRVNFIYSKPPAGDFPAVVAAVRTTLPTLLNYYFPFAGRIAVNPSTHSLDIICNNAGAELVEAHAGVSLASVNLSDVGESLDRIYIPFAGEICLCVQLVQFTCGGFSIVWASNHLLTDGYSHLMMAKLWAELARGAGELSFIPNHDRSLLKPRGTLHYSPAIENAYRTITADDMINVMASGVFVRRLYHVGTAELDHLRGAAVEADGGAVRVPTRMEAFSAYVWKALARAIGDGDTCCRMGWLVDGRRRFRSRDMRNFVGNLISFAAGEATVNEVVKVSTLGSIVGLVRKAISMTATESHFLGLNDWFEAHKGSVKIARVQLGLGSPAVIISSCHNMDVNMDFGFGRPKLVVPQISWGRLGSCFMVIARDPKDDGSWIVSAFVWPKLAAEFESDPTPILRPLTAESLGFREPTDHVDLISRL